MLFRQWRSARRVLQSLAPHLCHERLTIVYLIIYYYCFCVSAYYHLLWASHKRRKKIELGLHGLFTEKSKKILKLHTLLLLLEGYQSPLIGLVNVIF